MGNSYQKMSKTEISVLLSQYQLNSSRFQGCSRKKGYSFNLCRWNKPSA